MSIIPVEKSGEHKPSPLSRMMSRFRRPSSSVAPAPFSGFMTPWDDETLASFFGTPWAMGEEMPWQPACEIQEKNDRYLLTLELPGLTKKDVTVKVENGVLSVEGERKHEETRKSGNVTRSERFYGTFYRGFQLPESVDQEKIAASFDNGLLTVDLAKSREAQASRRDVPVT